MPKETAKSKRNTSKTARVLGLLTSPSSSAAPDAAASDSPARPAVKQSDDQVVERQIRDALESELDGALPSRRETEPQAPEKPAPAPAPEEPAVEEEPVEEEPVPEEPAAEEEPISEEPAKEEPAPAPAPESAPAAAPAREPDAPRSVTMRSKLSHAPAPDQDFTCFNVMQALVESKAEKYIKLFGLCTCPRCHADVVALSLSNLPAKYVVTSNEEMVPLLSVYEGTYSAAVISQVMNSCKKVMMNPRHKR